MQGDPGSRSNPGLAIILILAIWGAIADSRYKKAGGVRPTRRERLYLATGALACVGFLATMWIMGGNPEGFGYGAFLFAEILFALWQFGRWRIRRSHPLSEQPNRTGQQGRS